MIGLLCCTNAYDPARNRIAIGSPRQNRVLLLRRVRKDALPGDFTTPGVLQLTPHSAQKTNFGDAVVGGAEVAYGGADAVDVSDVSIDSASFVVTSVHNTTLGKGANLFITIAFRPAAGGPQTATVSLNLHNDPKASASFFITSNGVSESKR
jgi:hypothetical protein